MRGLHDYLPVKVEGLDGRQHRQGNDLSDLYLFLELDNC